jgi:hypothetical protein
MLSAVVVKDLTGIDEGNSDWYDEQEKQINVEKILLLGTILNVKLLTHKEMSYLLSMRRTEHLMF